METNNGRSSSVLPAIVAIGYNRPDALRRLLMSIGRADYTGLQNVPLVISLDKSENQSEVIAVAEAFDWPHGDKRIRQFDTRQGLRAHVLCCGDLAEEYGAVILLEDDLLVSRAFYRYAVDALAYYGDAPELAGFALYSHAWNGYADVQFIAQKNAFDTYLGQFSITWGQCWSAAQWRRFRQWYDVHPKLPSALAPRVPTDVTRWPDTSWGKYFVYFIVENNLYYVVPYVSLSTNCEEAGQHAEGGSDAHQVMLLSDCPHWRFAPVNEAVAYDIFFERIGLPLPPASGVSITDVLVDLNDQKRDAADRRYLLTTARYDLPIVRSFGLRMRPIESNVTYDIAGDDIRLYDTKDVDQLKRLSGCEQRRMRYETYRLGWRRLLRHALNDMFTRIGGRLRRLIPKGGA